jgi:hypothetical protein
VTSSSAGQKGDASPPPGVGAVRAAFWGVLVWVTSEFVIRGPITLLVLIAWGWRLPEELPLAKTAIVEAGMLWAAVVVPAWLVYRRTRREELTWRQLGYEISWYPVLLGLACGLGAVTLLEYVTGPLDRRLFGSAASELVRKTTAAGGWPGALLLLPSNGILGPIAEEFVWRAYIQTRLALEWGVWPAVTVTAVMFAAKHLIVDVSVERITSLLVLAFSFGLIALRWGTLASTFTHLAVNFTATLLSIIEQLRTP